MTQILLTSSLLILLIVLLRRLLRGRVSHCLLYGIWLLVALRLLIPFQFGQFQYSVATLTEQSQPVRQLQSILQEPVLNPSWEQLPNEESTLSPQAKPENQIHTEEESAAPSLQDVLIGIWVGGMAVMGIWFLATNLLFLHQARRSAIPLPETADKIPVRISEYVPTPCLAGLFRPVIYLTPASAEDPRHREHVLTHERTHLRHGDHIWSWIRCLCLCIYWFDPLVWLAAILSKRDCELACDESALKKLGDEERVAYGKTLLYTVTQHRSPTHILETATAMNETKKQLKERVSFIVKKPKNLMIATVSLILVAAIAAGCAFTGSKPAEQLQNDELPSVTETPEDFTEPTAEQQTTAPTQPKTDKKLADPPSGLEYEPGTILLGGQGGEYNFLRPYRELYYTIYGVFLDLLTEEQLQDYYSWSTSESERTNYGEFLEEMYLVSFVKRYNISREDFDSAVERYIAFHEFVSPTMLHESSEVPNADVIYTFDNEIINHYYRYE